MPKMMFLKSKLKKTGDGHQHQKKKNAIINSHYGSSVKTIHKKKSKALQIFRRKGSSSKTDNTIDAPQTIQPALTWTNSEDSSILDNSSIRSGSTTNQNILELAGNSALLFPIDIKAHATKDDFEYILAKHKTEIEEKQVEIEVMQDQIALLNDKTEEQSKTIDSVKTEHQLAIHEKIMELKSMQSRMVIMKNQHDEEIELLESTVQAKETEVMDLTARLNSTKKDLFEVSSNLIQTQHKLHDLSTAWPYRFFV